MCIDGGYCQNIKISQKGVGRVLGVCVLMYITKQQKLEENCNDHNGSPESKVIYVGGDVCSRLVTPRQTWFVSVL